MGAAIQPPPPGSAIVIAGATGFVGMALAEELGKDFKVVGLSRCPPHGAQAGPITWKQCDLFSLVQCEAAVKGAHCAFYLVHSMMSSAQLTQGDFEDMDLILADNFARAAALAGVRQIVYLGGLIPHDTELSLHLKSRLEVERVLGSRGVPVTALRAGIIVGAKGSSFRMLKLLLERVPVIPCPAFMDTLTQPVALQDVLKLLRWVMEHPHAESRRFDIGSPDVMTYRELLKRTARLLGLKRIFVDIPVTGTQWGWRFVSWVTGAPREIVEPLLESMMHPMTARSLSLQAEAGVPGLPFEDAVRETLREIKGARPRKLLKLPPLGSYDVRSVQRMPLPRGMTARQAAERYSVWLPGYFKTFLRAEGTVRKGVRFRFVFPRVTLLELAFLTERSGRTDRQIFWITGGLLARDPARHPGGRPRLEFREALGGKALLVAIHDYRPALPGFIYRWTQAALHLWVMNAFRNHLERLCRKAERDPKVPGKKA